MEANSKYFRYPAEKVFIRQLLKGEYIEEKEESPNYLLIDEEKKIFKVNLIATIVNKEKIGSLTNFLLDDGTGEMILRFFEEDKKVDGLKIGDTIICLARPRKYNQEKYLSPEICKKINPLWLKVRQKELKRKNKDLFQEKPEEADIGKNLGNALEKDDHAKNNDSKSLPDQELEEINEEIIENIAENSEILPFQKMANLIKEMDKGNGVPIEEIIEKSKEANTEELINKMMERGDIFQNQPGKVKVL